MTLQPQSPMPQSFPLHELAQLERALSAAQDYVATLQQRHNLLTIELDRLTRPAPPVPKIVGPGFRYRGEMVTTWCAIDIHVGLLRRLWTDYPEKRGAMARARRARLFAHVRREHARSLAPGQAVKLGCETLPPACGRLGGRHQSQPRAHRNAAACGDRGRGSQVGRRRAGVLARHAHLAQVLTDVAQEQTFPVLRSQTST